MGMAFKAKTIDPVLWEEVLQSNEEKGSYITAEKYYEKTGLSRSGLYWKLRHLKPSGETVGEEETEKSGGDKIVEGYKARAVGRKEAYEGIKLTPKERKLIKDIAEGTVDMQKASRVIAAKAFEKLLKFPDSASFTSFIQSEMLNLKRQELTDKNTWAMELVNRMFAGALPPRVCPRCGEVLVKLPELVGKVEDAESLSLTGED